MAGDLGSLYFTLGLDSQKFDEAIKKAKEKVAELTGEASITINADASNVAAQVQDDLNKITGKKTEIKLGIDKSSKASVEELVKDIANAEKELERLKSKESWNAAAIGRQEGFVANLKRQLEEAKAVKVAATEAKEAISNIAQSTQTVQHIVREADINLVRELKEELVGVNEQLELRNRLEQGKRDAADKNKAEREEAARVKAEQKAIENAQKKAAKEEKARIKAEEKAAKDAEREEAARLRRLDKESKAVQKQQLAEQKVLEGRKKMQEEEYNLTRWARKQEVANSSIYESAEYRREQNLLKKQYEDEERAAKAKIANEVALEKAARERAEISAQWIGEQRKHNKEIAKQEAERIRQEEKELELMAKKRKFSADWINNTRTQNEVQKRNETSVSRSELQNQLTQLQRLEEAIKKLQYTKVDIDTSDVDKDSEAYKKAAKALDSYIDKLQEMQSSGKRLKGREVTDAIGIDMNRVIAQSTSSVAEQIRIQRKATVEATRAKKEEEGRVKLVDKLANKLKNSSDWASQLNNQLTNAFSIYSIERFIRSLYTVGGEFQKQQIALQNMIGDVDRGNAIFERMKDLAVKSPFTFSDLASYTKQMSAYGIEYENLYDTTKRLADISAGVGVDMGRLILAFGQVRSAAVLRGQELRQFTEAGIPLVAELAKKFTELEGRVVSTGEVFDKISKREVSFGMVKDILFDMTDPGGRFFETQEKLAESLAGKWSNLKDAWDIMIADIANGNNSVLSGLADIINSLIRGFETWLPFVSGAIVALGLLRGAITAVNIVSTASPWVLIGSVMAGVVSTVISLASETETATELITRLNRELEGVVAQNNDNERNANRYLDILKKQADSESDKYALYQKQKAAFEELLKLYPKATEIAELELMTLEEIEKTRKRIAEQTKKDNLNQYDVRIDEAYDAYEKKRIDTEKILRDSGKTIEDFPETKKELEALYNLYTNAMNAKEMYEQSFIDAARPKPLADWQIKADEIIAKYPNIAALKRDKGDDIWAYFDFLEATFKEAKEKYDRVTSESMKKPYKSIMDAVNAVNMGIGGVSLYDSKKKKGGKSEAKKAAERDAKAYLEALKAKLSELGSQWDLYKDLFEATGDKRLSMNIAFDGVIPNFDNYISHLKGLMQEEIQKRGLGISVADLLSEGKEGIAKRVNDKSQTAWTEDVAKNLNAIIDSYNSANKKLREESVRNFIDIIKNSKDFAQQIADIDRELQKDLSDLAKMSGGTDSELYKRRAEELIKRAEEDKTKVNFEEFKKSSDWVKVFDDLDRVSDATLDNMISKIEEFAKQAHLSEEVTKQLVDAMAKLRKETIERNPFKGFEDAWKRLKYFKGLNSKVGEYDEHGKLITQQMVDDGIAEANDDLEKASLAVADKFQAVANAADLLSGIFDGLGIDLGSLKDVLGGIAGGAQSGAGIAAAFGASGPWGAIAGAAIGAISALFAQVDKNLQKEIEASERREKEIGYVAERLEKVLERNMGGIYTITLNDDVKSTFSEVIGDFNRLQAALTARNNGEISWDIIKTIREFAHLQEDTIETIKDALTEDSYYDAQLAALKVQRDEVRKQMELEDEKKKTNEDKILDYKNQIAELDDAISHFAEDMANALYGIDFKDWASKLAESLVDAWASGEDAVQAYKDKVNDILKDLGVSVISQQILEPMLNNTMKQFLAQFDKDNGKLTDSSMEILAGMADGAEYAAKATEAYLEGLKKLGIDLSEKNESEAGGLSKGIQSVTEDTADLLASYVNGMRADLSVNRALIEQLVSVDVPQMSIIAQAQLQQLQQVAANTKRNADAADRIYELVNKVVDKGSNKLKI